MRRAILLTALTFLLAACVTAVHPDLPLRQLQQVRIAAPLSLVASIAHPNSFVPGDVVPVDARVQLLGTDPNAAWLLVLHDDKLGWMPGFFSADNIATVKPPVVIAPLDARCTRYLDTSTVLNDPWISTTDNALIAHGVLYRSAASSRFNSAELAIQLGGKGRVPAAEYMHLPLTSASSLILFSFALTDVNRGDDIRFSLTNTGGESILFQVAFYADNCGDNWESVAAPYTNRLPVGTLRDAIPTLRPQSATPTPSPTATITYITRVPTPTGVAASPTARGERVVFVTAAVLNVRSSPNTEDAPIGQVRNGDRLVVQRDNGDGSWLLVTLPNGGDGWVFAAFTSSVPVTPSPSIQPQTTAVACRYSVDNRLAPYWSSPRFGCAQGPAGVTWAAWQPFQRGEMLWRQDTDAAYVFNQGAGWQEVADRWQGQTLSGHRGLPPAGLQAPVRGFGYIWENNDTIYRNIGWARDQEKGFCALVQSFAGGFILRSTQDTSCYQGLYNFGQEPGFGLQVLEVPYSGGWALR